MTEKTFLDDLKIDKFALDDECVEHAKLVADWGLQWADAVYERDRLKDHLDLVRGQCDQEIREKPSNFGWQKPDKAPTEGFISSAIFTHVDYVEANKQYQDAQYQVNVLSVAKNAFEHRDKRMSDLAKLFSSGYFSSNKKLDQGYRDMIERENADRQVENLSQNPRLRKRAESGQ